jgi:hypothetical protein
MSSEWHYEYAFIQLRGTNQNWMVAMDKSIASNEFPTKPRWWPYSFRKQADAFLDIEKHALQFDNGTNRGPYNRTMSSAAAVNMWEKAFADARLASGHMRLTFDRESRTTPYFEVRFEAMQKRCREVGADLLEAETNNFDLGNPLHVDVLCEFASSENSYERMKFSRHLIFKGLAELAPYKNFKLASLVEELA